MADSLYISEVGRIELLQLFSSAQRTDHFSAYTAVENKTSTLPVLHQVTVSRSVVTSILGLAVALGLQP